VLATSLTNGIISFSFASSLLLFNTEGLVTRTRDKTALKIFFRRSIFAKYANVKGRPCHRYLSVKEQD